MSGIFARNVFAKQLRIISLCHLLFGVGCAMCVCVASVSKVGTAVGFECCGKSRKHRAPTRHQCVITTENSSATKLPAASKGCNSRDKQTQRVFAKNNPAVERQRYRHFAARTRLCVTAGARTENRIKETTHNPYTMTHCVMTPNETKAQCASVTSTTVSFRQHDTNVRARFGVPPAALTTPHVVGHRV